MATHSKGNYVAYRSHRNAPTTKQWAFTERMRIAEELRQFCDEPFPNGATIKEWNGVDGGMAPDGTIVRCIS